MNFSVCHLPNMYTTMQTLTMKLNQKKKQKI